ncbi:NACHT domain-containing protein [Streptomyces longwoodensis]|uniref:HEAT repeat domain-containing protein n=1 Tax=Streptomyces longwoodensis TaxID=68231 RepID=UPI00340D7DEC
MSADGLERATADCSGAETAPASGPVTARGVGAVAAGENAFYNATAKGATVIDARTFVAVAPPDGAGEPELTPEEERAYAVAYAEQLNVLYGRLDLEVLVPTTEGEHPRMELREVFVPPSLRADPPRVELPVELYRRLVDSGELQAPEGVRSLPSGMDQRQWDLARQAYRERPAIALLDTLASRDTRRIVLLGDPGAGKSTLARFLALTLVSDSCTGPLQALAGLLPVVVELRRYAEADWRERSFEDFLAHLHEQEGHAPFPALLRQRLREGRALVVFDGLDELFDPKIRETVTRRITGFTSRYPQARVVVTSRVIGYRRHLLDAAGFRHYMIQDLSDEQIRAFAEQWYAAAGLVGKDGERLHTRLLDAIARSRPVRELAGNPLLLTILAIIARRQRLPRDRAGVYQHAVNVLIAHWDEDTKHLDLAPGVKAIADLDDRDRREMLERLARHMQSGEGGIAGNHVLAEDVEKVFTDYLRETLQLQTAPATTVARAMVNQFRERNFILSRYGSEVYGFVHRAFLEYLAASDIVRRYEQRELSDDDLLDKVFRQRASDPHWHEVLLLIVAQTGERFAARAVDTILGLPDDSQGTAAASPPVLALHALSEVRRIGALAELSTRAAQVLVRHLEDNRHSTDSELDLETALNLLGPEWVGARHLLRWLHCDESGGTYELYALITDKEALQAVSLAAPTPHGRATALTHLAVRWAEDPAARSFVKERAMKDPDPDTRADVLYEMALAWPDDPHLLHFLSERMKLDPHRTVRMSAVSALAHMENEQPAVRALLSAFITDPAAPEDLRARAVETLASLEGASADDDVRQLLTRHALGEPSDQIRSAAHESLATLFGHIPAVRKFLLERIAAVPDEDGSWKALGALAGADTDDPDIRRTVLSYATSSTSDLLRQRAVRIYTVCYWKKDEDARAVIRTWGCDDAEAGTRASVLIELRLKHSDDADALEFVVARLSRDPDVILRRALLERLADFGATRPALLLQALQHSAVEDRDGQCRAAALKSMVNWWGDGEDVRSFVKARAATDPSDDVRAAAQEYLAHVLPPQDTPRAITAALRRRVLDDASHACFDYVCEQLQQSPHHEVRLAAAQLLSTCWATDSRTVPALRAQAGKEEDPDNRAHIENAITTAATYVPVYQHLF